jgi:hypothetical protein
MEHPNINHWWKTVCEEAQAEHDRPINHLDVTAYLRTKDTGEKTEARKKVTRYDYTQGPIHYLALQAVRGMQEAGYPSKTYECYRSAERQARLYAQGRTEPGKIVTKAEPFSSAHQYFLAADIIHETRGWNVSDDYWETLSAVLDNLGNRFSVKLNHGHYWKFRDSAHFELEDWRYWRDKIGPQKPTNSQLDEMFAEILPSVWWAKKHKS